MAETVTVVGNVGSDPQHVVTPSGLSITKFSVGCTHRVLDSTTGKWIDKNTNWYQVSTFRQVADHAYASIKRGDSVIVTGRIFQRQWEANGRAGMSVDLEADTVGHDLRWGTSTWARKPKAGVASPGAEPEQSDAASDPAASTGDGFVTDTVAWPVAQGAELEAAPY